jgi:hypothetical protein
VNETKKCVDMDLQTMKEEGQRERKIRTAGKGEEQIKQNKGKEKKGKRRKGKQNKAT